MITETNTNYSVGCNLTCDIDSSPANPGCSEIPAHVTHMNRGIGHATLPLSRLKQIKVTPEQNKDFLKRFDEHKMYCVECHSKKLTETALSHSQTDRFEENPFPQESHSVTRT